MPTLASKTRLEAEKKLIDNLLRSKEARIFFGLLLQETNFFGSSLDPDSPALSAFHEGERFVGKRIFEMIWNHSQDRKAMTCLKEYGVWAEKVKQLEEQLEGNY